MNVDPASLGRRFMPVFALVALAGMLLVACGDDADGESSVEALKIGYLADFSGPLAEFGPEIQTGVEMAIEHINAAGGVNGQPVSFITGDDRTDPTAAVEEARRLVEIEGVHAIVGPLGSGVALAVAESVTGPAGIVTISPSATSPALTNAADGGYLFRTTVSDAAQGVVLAQLADQEGLTNVAALYLNNAYGQGLLEAFQGSYGGTVTAASYEENATTYLSELQSAAGGGAEVLIAIGYPAQAEIYLREAIENGLFDRFLFVDGTKSEDLIAAIGAERLEGMRGTAPTGGPETDALRSWNEAYEARFGALPTRPYVREAYDATIAIALAAEKSGAVSGAAFRDALREISSPPGDSFIPGEEGIAGALEAIRDGNDVNYEGAATSVDWDQNGDVVTGFIGIFEYAGGTIVERETVPFDLSEG